MFSQKEKNGSRDTNRKQQPLKLMKPSEQGKGIEIERLDKIVHLRGPAPESRGAPENFRGPRPKIRGGRGPPGPPYCAPPDIS